MEEDPRADQMDQMEPIPEAGSPPTEPVADQAAESDAAAPSAAQATAPDEPPPPAADATPETAAPSPPGYAAYPTYPGAPPSQPSGVYTPYPAYPTYPTYPVPPTYPAYPGFPGYPPYPSYPSYPSQPLAPVAPGVGAPATSPLQPGTPGAPPYPGYAPYAGYAPYPGYAYAPPSGYGPYAGPPAPPWSTRLAARLAFLARPLSRRVAALVAVGALLVVVGAAAFGLFGSHGDWATGAIWAGSASLALGALWLIAILARAALGQRARAGILTGLAAVLVLMTLGGAGLALPNPLHAAQAHALEASHDWNGALREYQLAGQRAPGSHDLARVYDEWGDALAGQNQYARAVAEYQVVVRTYSDATAEVQRAWSGLFQTYTAWFATNIGVNSYAGILSDLTGYLQMADCDASCQANVSALEPQTHYQYGVQLANHEQYVAAITQFELIASQFPKSPYAPRAHSAAATAYYALGLSELTSYCPAALSAYQTLASKYADTPEGAQAKAALEGPVDVTGVLTNYPASSPPTMYLSSHVYTYSFSDEYRATLDGSGRFTFRQVEQGKYNLSELRVDGSQWYWVNKATGDPYTISVGPLCTQDIGTYSYG